MSQLALALDAPAVDPLAAHRARIRDAVHADAVTHGGHISSNRTRRLLAGARHPAEAGRPHLPGDATGGADREGRPRGVRRRARRQSREVRRDVALGRCAMSLPDFPVDDSTLDLAWLALNPGPESERTSLADFMEFMSQMGGSDTAAVDSIEWGDPLDMGESVEIHIMRDAAYHEHDLIRALITEVRRLRGAP